MNLITKIINKLGLIDFQIATDKYNHIAVI